MPRPKLEVADILSDYGPAWRRANAGHVNLSQLKVMSAIEACRTEALGGHVAACTKCSHSNIAYNSCKNRHCPKCQGPAARDWMAARAEDLLPVEYFHVVFTLPRRDRPHRILEQEGCLWLIVPRVCPDGDCHCSRPQTPRRAGRHDQRAAYLGFDSHPPPSCPHDRSRWWPVERRHPLGRVQARFLSARPSVVTALSAFVYRRVDDSSPRRRTVLLQ